VHFHCDGAIHKVARITGPTHNLLGIEFHTSKETEALAVDALPEDRGRGVKLDEAEVVRHVLTGISEANEKLRTAYRPKRIQYVPGDSAPTEIYRLLAAAIVEHMHRESLGR